MIGFKEFLNEDARPTVSIRGKAPSPDATLSYRGKTWKVTNRKDAEKIKVWMEKMLGAGPIHRQMDGFVLDFGIDLDQSGEHYSLGKRGRVWGIGLAWSHYEQALAVAAHEIGHLTQKPLGGMGVPGYVDRRLAHEKQAWNRGLSLLKKVGYVPTKDFMETRRGLMNTALYRYYEHLTGRGYR